MSDQAKTREEQLAAELDEARRRIATLEDSAWRRHFHGTVVDSMQDGLVVLDTDGVHVDANPAFCRMSGFSREELVGTGLPHVYWPPEAQAAIQAAFQRAASHEGQMFELTFMRKSGERFPVLITSSLIRDEDGTPRLAFGTIKDVSALRQAEASLAASETSFRSLVEHLDDVVVRYDPELRFTYVSPSIGSLAPMSPDEMVGKTNAEAGFLGELVELFDDNLRCVREERKPRVVEFPISGFPGERYGEARVYPELDDEGRLSSLLAIARDITERKRAEAELRELNATLERHVAERTAQLSAANRELEGFVHSIAHDLRGPLRAIGSFAQIVMLDHAEDLGDDGREAMQRIVRANDRQRRLIDGLLELSSLAHNQLRVAQVDLGALALEIIDELRKTDAERDVDMRVAPDLLAEADPALVSVVLENLLDNAWKFTAGRTPAHIEIGRSDTDGAFFVRDDGAGFDPAYTHRLFRAFERLHDDTEFGGTGIGLATVKRIVERHGGHVWAEGAPGRGATFFFTLPAAAPGSAGD